MAKRTAEVRRLTRKAKAQARRVTKTEGRHRPTVDVIRKTRTPRVRRKRKGGDDE